MAKKVDREEDDGSVLASEVPSCTGRGVRTKRANRILQGDTHRNSGRDAGATGRPPDATHDAQEELKFRGQRDGLAALASVQLSLGDGSRAEKSGGEDIVLHGRILTKDWR